MTSGFCATSVIFRTSAIVPIPVYIYDDGAEWLVASIHTEGGDLIHTEGGDLILTYAHARPSPPQDGCTPLLKGPYLHVASVPQWGPALVVSHRKANDDHIRVLQLGGGGEAGGGGDGGQEEAPRPPLEVMVTGENTRIALPNAPGGDDNFVVGLAIDTSCNAVSQQLPPRPAICGCLSGLSCNIK